MFQIYDPSNRRGCIQLLIKGSISEQNKIAIRLTYFIGRLGFKVIKAEQLSKL